MARAPSNLYAGSPPVIVATLAEKGILKLVHPGIGEQKRLVVARHQRRTWHDAVIVRFEEIQEALSDLSGRHRSCPVTIVVYAFEVLVLVVIGVNVPCRSTSFITRSSPATVSDQGTIWT